MYNWDQLDEKISRMEQVLVSILLTLMILMAFSQIVLRNFFDTGISWGDSLVRYLVVWVGFIGAAIAAREGKPLPEGWAVDNEGKSITDPKEYYQIRGAILPLGGIPQTGSFKGFGLTVAVDILCRILSGALPDTQMAGCHFFGALKIDGFMPAEKFKKAMDGMIQEYRALPKAPGVDRIYLSGEIEQDIERKRKQDGIPLHPAIISSLKELAEELGVEYNL